jgi:CheY-like chemotaxis protein
MRPAEQQERSLRSREMPTENACNRQISYNLLLVENSADDAELFIRALRRAQLELDFEIRTQTITSSSQAALQIKAQKFDVIFLDIGMPAPDGIELTRQIRHSWPNRSTPIVIITGAEDRGLMTRAFEAGANWFLCKPIDRVRLLRLIQTSRAPIDRERRRRWRVKVKCKVSIEMEGVRLQGETLDLSLNGMSVLAGGVLPVGSSVRVVLALPNSGAPIRTAARVVRSIGRDAIGLELEQVMDAEHERLAEFLVPLIDAAIEEEDAKPV